MRIVFVGAVEGSKIAFNALLQAGFAPKLLITLPPEAADRHSDFVDLSGTAAVAGVPVLRCRDVNSSATLEAVEAQNPDFCFIIGWSQICREPFRTIARSGNIGYHPSPLPKFRGRAVIPWTILQGESISGSTLFWIDEGVDSGPVLLQRIFSVSPDETARSLYDKHMSSLVSMMAEAVDLLSKGDAPRRPQDHSQASYCSKRTPEDGVIDWRKSATDILRLIRAVGEPYPGAFTFEGGKKVLIDAARTVPGSAKYIGLPGQVQSHTSSGFIVKCGDGECVEVLAWRPRVGDRPKLHRKLGKAS